MSQSGKDRAWRHFPWLLPCGAASELLGVPCEGQSTWSRGDAAGPGPTRRPFPPYRSLSSDSMASRP